jgi:low affinity Fe/Cu permease
MEPRHLAARLMGRGAMAVAGTIGGRMKNKSAQASTHHQEGKMSRLGAMFANFAQKTAAWTGHATAFLIAVAIVVVWIVTGPIFNYSDTWQLVINTGTTIITFLMVFLIQNTQNRDMLSMQLKLSELVLAMKGAEDKFASIEDLSDDELRELHEESRRRADIACHHLETREAGKPTKTAAHRVKTAQRRSAKA